MASPVYDTIEDARAIKATLGRRATLNTRVHAYLKGVLAEHNPHDDLSRQLVRFEHLVNCGEAALWKVLKPLRMQLSSQQLRHLNAIDKFDWDKDKLHESISIKTIAAAFLLTDDERTQYDAALDYVHQYEAEEEEEAAAAGDTRAAAEVSEQVSSAAAGEQGAAAGDGNNSDTESVNHKKHKKRKKDKKRKEDKKRKSADGNDDVSEPAGRVLSIESLQEAAAQQCTGMQRHLRQEKREGPANVSQKQCRNETHGAFFAYFNGGDTAVRTEFGPVVPVPNEEASELIDGSRGTKGQQKSQLVAIIGNPPQIPGNQHKLLCKARQAVTNSYVRTMNHMRMDGNNTKKATATEFTMFQHHFAMHFDPVPGTSVPPRQEKPLLKTGNEQTRSFIHLDRQRKMARIGKQDPVTS